VGIVTNKQVKTLRRFKLANVSENKPKKEKECLASENKVQGRDALEGQTNTGKRIFKPKGGA